LHAFYLQVWTLIVSDDSQGFLAVGHQFFSMYDHMGIIYSICIAMLLLGRCEIALAAIWEHANLGPWKDLDACAGSQQTDG
jgi:hypothetical protein